MAAVTGKGKASIVYLLACLLTFALTLGVMAFCLYNATYYRMTYGAEDYASVTADYAKYRAGDAHGLNPTAAEHIVSLRDSDCSVLFREAPAAARTARLPVWGSFACLFGLEAGIAMVVYNRRAAGKH